MDLFLNSVPFHRSVGLSLPQYHVILIMVAFTVSLKISWCKSSNLFFLKLFLGESRSFAHPINFKIGLSTPTTKLAEILTRTAINLLNKWGRTGVLTILNLPTHEPSTPLH